MSVNGKVIPHTPLAVDFWQVRKCPGTRLFFLSHMHSDHTVGLTSTWSNRPIYCSPTTATLLRLKLQVKEKWIHPLELDEPYLLPMDDIGKEKLTVTLIEANHCPGSVMFLFEGYFGSILYTGDFRYTPSMLLEPCLRTHTTIDVLYMDNTNCDPNHTLPSRQQATQQIKEIIRRHPNHNVVIGLYALGKESLLVELAMEFKTWVEVSFERMQTLKALELPDVFTTEPGAGRIRVVEQSKICSANVHKWDKEQPTLAILPTSRPLVSFHPNVHVVPYSDHSSYQELEDFVSALKPTSLVPIVGNHVPASFSALLPHRKRHEILVPECVRHYMLSQPESQLSSSANTSPRRRHFQPLLPKGVLFDSPVRGAGKSGEEATEPDASEEEMDAEVSENDSDCILVDPSKYHTPKKNRGGTGDMCLNIVKTTRTPFETNAKIISETVSNDIHSSPHMRHSNVQNNDTLSADESMSLLSGQRIEQDCDNESDDQMNNSVATLQSRLGKDCISSSSSSAVLKQNYIEEIENSLLKNLPFTEGDFKMCGLLQQSFVKRYSLLPLCHVSDDDLSDK
ncbi:5' exonuclease Apollo [Trematomus bernacchii]|uniref:5' exonuclease Apollo n=1 Tax=Trematomus bernacchii TaxID=40690 RepID=UPI00146EF747|nr:5' exonuclease Apollo [Trematomus bernacchii]